MKRMVRPIAFNIGLTLLLVCVLSNINVIKTRAANGKNANRMNVVFVMDQSGSMFNTDRNSLRYEAVDLFLGLATDSGNYMGAVVFDDEIVLQKDIKVMNGKAAKTELSNSIRAATSNGDTDIGKAIELATDMLRNSGNKELDSVIILLSDGNTDLPKDKTGQALEASKASKQNAINNANNNGYKIHSICLNSNGKANPEELRMISDATGGVSVEVRSAKDLKEVFNQFYNIIYSTETVVLADTLIPDSGRLEISFQIPMIGVEEANIIINTLNPTTSYSIWKPDGQEMAGDELESVKITANTFSIIKIPNPSAGTWKIIVQGISGDQVKIDMVYNSNLVIGTQVNHGKETCNLGEDIYIAAQLYNNGISVTDSAIYEAYPIIAYIQDVTTGKLETLELSAAGSEVQGTYPAAEYTDYNIQVGLTIDNISVASSVYHVSVGNNAPKASPYINNVKKVITPFTKNDYVLRLDEIITDDEDVNLGFCISSSDFDSKFAYIEDKELHLNLKECKQGEMMIVGMDSRGASAEMKVVVRTISLLVIVAFIFGPILIIVATILIMRFVKAITNPINGRIQIMPYNEDGTDVPRTYEGTKGKMVLSRYVTTRKDIGIKLGRCYLKAGEESSYIYFISKDGYYTDRDPETKQKRIQLNSDMEMDISNDREFQKGMRITYIADEADY